MNQNQSGSAQCTVCGTMLAPTDRFCPSCGAPNPGHVPAAERPSPQPAPPPPAGQSQLPAGHYTLPSQPPWSAVPPAEPPSGQSNRRTWYILGGIFAFFVLVCCCCALLIAVASAQDSALQEELEGTARLLTALGKSIAG